MGRIIVGGWSRRARICCELGIEGGLLKHQSAAGEFLRLRELSRKAGYIRYPLRRLSL